MLCADHFNNRQAIIIYTHVVIDCEMVKICLFMKFFNIIVHSIARLLTQSNGSIASNLVFFQNQQ